jgi:hypothetical protein
MNSPGFPVCKPGGIMCDPAERELTCGKKSAKRKRLPLPPYALFGYLIADKSFSGIMALCHTPENCYQC